MIKNNNNPVDGVYNRLSYQAAVKQLATGSKSLVNNG